MSQQQQLSNHHHHHHSHRHHHHHHRFAQHLHCTDWAGKHSPAVISGVPLCAVLEPAQGSPLFRVIANICSTLQPRGLIQHQSKYETRPLGALFREEENIFSETEHSHLIPTQARQRACPVECNDNGCIFSSSLSSQVSILDNPLKLLKNLLQQTLELILFGRTK